MISIFFFLTSLIVLSKGSKISFLVFIGIRKLGIPASLSFLSNKPLERQRTEGEI